MKKILLVIMMMVSVSFAGSIPPLYYNHNGTIYKRYWFGSYGSYGGVVNVTSSSGIYACSYASQAVSFAGSAYSSSPNNGLTLRFYLNYQYDTSTAIAPNYLGTCYYEDWGAFYNVATDCPSPKVVVDGQCVNATPTCVTGSHVDVDLNVCVSDYEQLSKNTFENGNFDVVWADGAVTYCDVSTEKCITWDKDFNVIPNRYLNPELNPDGTIKYEGIVPDAMETASWSSVAYDAYGKPITNAIGKVLQAFGWVIAYEGTGGGYVVSDSPGLNSLNPFAVLGSGMFALGSAMVTPDNDVVVATPLDTSNGVSVNISSNNSGISFDSLQSVASSTPENGTPIFSKDGVYTYKQITDANLKTVWDTAAGVGTLPPTALVLGSDIIYPTNNPNTAIINSPTQIEVVKTSPDNSAQSVVVNKADLANTASSGTDLPYVVKNYEAPVINNDGTKTQQVTSTPSSTSPTTGNTTSTNPTTGATTTTKPTGTSANGSNGTNFDVSALTGRLDSLGNQLTKLNGLTEKGNGLAETGNGILSNIQNNTASAKNSLNGIESAVNSIKSLLSDGDIPTTPHNIPSDTSGADWNSWSATWDNLLTSFNGVSSKVDEVSALFQNGFSLNLSGGTVTTCVYSQTIDFVYFTVPFEFDPCSFLSQFRPIFYTFFYLLFVLGVLSFATRAVLRMV